METAVTSSLTSLTRLLFWLLQGQIVYPNSIKVAFGFSEQVRASGVQGELCIYEMVGRRPDHL